MPIIVLGYFPCFPWSFHRGQQVKLLAMMWLSSFALLFQFKEDKAISPAPDWGGNIRDGNRAYAVYFVT